jgi:hypothetical protein
MKIGNVARCKHGRLGIITKRVKHQYYGIGFDGSRWQSIEPKFVAETINDFIHQTADVASVARGFQPIGLRSIGE